MSHAIIPHGEILVAGKLLVDYDIEPAVAGNGVDEPSSPERVLVSSVWLILPNDVRVELPYEIWSTDDVENQIVEAVYSVTEQVRQ